MADRYVPAGTPQDNQNIEETKRCPDCGQSKPHDRFRRAPACIDGRHRYCRECENARRRAAYHRQVGAKPTDKQHISRKRLREAILEAQGDPPPGKR